MYRSSALDHRISISDSGTKSHFGRGNKPLFPLISGPTIAGVEVVGHSIAAPQVVVQPLQGLRLATLEAVCPLHGATALSVCGRFPTDFFHATWYLYVIIDPSVGNAVVAGHA